MGRHRRQDTTARTAVRDLMPKQCPSLWQHTVDRAGAISVEVSHIVIGCRLSARRTIDSAIIAVARVTSELYVECHLLLDLLKISEGRID